MRTCIVCGCTDDHACDGGCSWTELIGKNKGVCSACPSPVDPSKLTKRQLVRLRVLEKHVEKTKAKCVELFIRGATAESVHNSAVDNLREFHSSLAGDAGEQ